ncbi:8922_t:CDS:1 [Funneliformis caledonium]|uniref:8922_t:CDS:1 n=1 Tax=Funneliformis caledonium TaxID=1117310 RepID=A0A9N9A8H7_9GLOM|nr:8922_t:CDS:1 [Funneliformis caledonium]
MPYCYCFDTLVKLLKSKPSNSSKNPTPSLPSGCMKRIFSHVDSKEELFSCLLVNKYWCKNVLPLLWSNPFKGLESSKDYFKLIRMYLACLDHNELNFLNSHLKHYNMSLSIPVKPLFDYTSFLEEFSYKRLELGVSFFLREWHNRDHNIDFKEEIIYYLSSSIYKLFISQAGNLRSFKIDQHFRRLDIPDILTSSRTQSIIILSNLTKFQIDCKKPISDNLNNFLGIMPKFCTRITSMEIKISTFEYKFNIIQSIGNIIKEQSCLEEFGITGHHCVEDLMPSLLSKTETLTIVKFENVHFTECSLSSLAKFKNLNYLKIWYCSGLGSTSCKILLCGEFPNLTRLQLGSDDQDLTLAFLDKIGNSLKQLGLNVITAETVHAILTCCEDLLDLQIVDSYYPWENPWLFKLFHGLKRLENLSISISQQQQQHYKKMIQRPRIDAYDLPDTLRYLKLECDLPIQQLKRFLNLHNEEATPQLSTLIINDSNFNYSHMELISEFVKKSGTLKVLGIGGQAKLSWRTLRELKILRDKYGLHLIPKKELCQY